MPINKTLTHQHKYILTNHDLFESIKNRIDAGNSGSTVIVPHVCNNVDQFGAGFASAVASHYPAVKSNYHMLGKSFLRANLGYSQIINVHEDPKFKHKLIFVNMISQNGIKNPNNPRPLNYLALVKSMATVSNYINMNTGFIHKTENVEIHCPKFGSGLSGGDWNFISDLIDDIWGKYTVFVYNYKK
jgi:hypothetical protein